MLQIDDKLISLDLIERFFCCDLDSCLGQCCVEGDSGAPLTKDEYEKICDLIPLVWDSLSPAAQRVLEEQGPGYYDSDGDLVTSIVGDRDCVFTTYAPGGKCLCALEKLWREGKSDFKKPISCALYPVRVSDVGSYKALNYHRWKICKCAEVLGKKKGIRAYEFLRSPLEEAFGKDWYLRFKEAADEYLRQYGQD